MPSRAQRLAVAESDSEPHAQRRTLTARTPEIPVRDSRPSKLLLRWYTSPMMCSDHSSFQQRAVASDRARLGCTPATQRDNLEPGAGVVSPSAAGLSSRDSDTPPRRARGRRALAPPTIRVTLAHGPA